MSCNKKALKQVILKVQETVQLKTEWRIKDVVPHQVGQVDLHP